MGERIGGDAGSFVREVTGDEGNSGKEKLGTLFQKSWGRSFIY